MQDCVRKGRNRFGVTRGEEVSNHKLSLEEVWAVRVEYNRGSVRQTDLAKKYGVDQTTISRIVLRKAWAHV
jgi:DNA-binding MarR family transcriptional regulator